MKITSTRGFSEARSELSTNGCESQASSAAAEQATAGGYLIVIAKSLVHLDDPTVVVVPLADVAAASHPRLNGATR